MLFLAILVFLAALTGWIAASKPSQIAIDLSGYGNCNGTELTVLGASSWTQYPAPMKVTEVEPSAMLPAFVGRNSIVWAEGAPQGFVVKSVRQNIVTHSQALHVTGACHFTLDSTSSSLTTCIKDCNSPSEKVLAACYESCRYAY